MTHDEWRFWSKVDIRKDNECWPWLGATLDNGYGYFRFNKRNQIASRVAWQLNKGVKLVNNKVDVCHDCDNKDCMNPRHLFLGTRKKNLEDMVTKGRSLTGERNHQAKLTYHDVTNIRAMIQDRLPNDFIAKIMKISPSVISDIKRGVTWKI